MLENNEIKTTRWKSILPKSEFYLFVPRDEGLLESYEKNLKITDIFPINSVGIVTSRDSFVIDADKELLKRRIRMFSDKKIPYEIIRQTFNLKDKSNWKLKTARENVRKDENWENSITQILYRPFDTQWIFYHDAVIERSRKEVMQHMMDDNLGLITNRQVNKEFRHVLCSNTIINDCTVSLETRERSYLFPLYLYLYHEKKDLFSHKEGAEGRKPNINPELITALIEKYRKEPTPEDIFDYIYAVLYSNAYRTKYAEFLKIDFPRVPFTKDYKVFSKMVEHGKRLVDLLLLKSEELDTPIARFQGKGDDKVVKIKYEPVGQTFVSDTRETLPRIYINNDQYFEGIRKEVWEYQIGGYQVCEKWLKDRKGRRLSLDDIKHYCKVVTAIQKTIDVQKEIDDIYPEVEKEIIEFKKE